MPRATEAHITPKVLKWARESANMSLKYVVGKVKKRNVSEEDLASWERGERGTRTLTSAKLRDLAKLYRRSMAVFHWDKPPKDFEKLSDFRDKDNRKQLGHVATLIIREMRERQEWMRDYIKEDGGSSLPFVGSFSVRDNPKAVANDITKTLGIKPKDDLKTWREQCNKARIFLSMYKTLTLGGEELEDEYKGFALADQYAPFIFVNTQYSDNVQLFTLAHEIAHLWIGKSGLSYDIEEVLSNEKIEIFCNKVTANVLMPGSSFQGHPYQDYEAVGEIAEKFHVSKLAVIYRVWNLELINEQQFKEFKEQSQEEYEKSGGKQKKAVEGGGFYNSFFKRTGRLYTEIVMEAYRGMEIRFTEASSLLGMYKLKNLMKKLEK